MGPFLTNSYVIKGTSKKQELLTYRSLQKNALRRQSVKETLENQHHSRDNGPVIAVQN